MLYIFTFSLFRIYRVCESVFIVVTPRIRMYFQFTTFISRDYKPCNSSFSEKLFLDKCVIFRSFRLRRQVSSKSRSPDAAE